jgi:hypothetical protein
MFLLMMLGLALSVLVHRASSERKLHSRSGEYLGDAAGLALPIVGGRMLPTLGFVSVGELRVGRMLLVSTCMATCPRRAPGPPSSPSAREWGEAQRSVRDRT